MSPRTRPASPEDVRKIVAHAQEHLPCHDCGAASGEPCTEPGRGRTVCKSRYIAGAIAIRRQAKAERRTPEQAAELAAILARLPRVTPEEVEAGRSPRGGFTREQLAKWHVPWPPPPDGCRPSYAKTPAAMTADAALAAVTRRADRVRLERERELAELARLMREPGGLAEAPEPMPLHRQQGHSRRDGKR